MNNNESGGWLHHAAEGGTNAAMIAVGKFRRELQELHSYLEKAKRVLITAPGQADGDSLGSQLALRTMLSHRYPNLVVRVINDEPIPPRYTFLPGIETVLTPERFAQLHESDVFDVGVVVDGGIDRAGRVRSMFDKCGHTVFLDHHAVSADYNYSIRIVEPLASSNTELIYHMSQTPDFRTPVDSDFAQCVYLGLVFDTGFFRHSNTTPEAMVLGAELLKTGFDFTRVGERGMLERSVQGLHLLADTLSRAQQSSNGRIIWSTLTMEHLKRRDAIADDREGIIDQLFLTEGIEVAVLFIELSENFIKVSLRSQGAVDVAHFARSLTVKGGGHIKAAGANLDMDIREAIPYVLERLEAEVQKVAAAS